MYEHESELDLEPIWAFETEKQSDFPYLLNFEFLAI